MRWYQRARPWAIRFGTTPVGKQVGEKGYWWLATRLAKKWNDKDDTLSVGLRGGMTRQLQVGVSDMDFTLSLRWLTATSLRQWKREFLAARSRWGVIGEPVLVTPSLWKLFWKKAPATLHWYEHHQTWDGTGWNAQHRPLPPLHQGSRFAFAWDWFRQAVKLEHRWHLHQDEVSRELSRRILGKLEAYLQPTGPRWADIWFALHQLALEVPKETPCPLFPLSPEPLSESLRLHFRRWTHIPAEPTPIPFVWAVPPQKDLYFRWNHWRRQHPRVPPVVFVTPPMVQALAQGWCGWSPSSALADQQWRGEMTPGPQGVQSLEQRLANDLVSLPGRYLWLGEQTYQRELKRVSLEALHLTLNHWSARDLWPKARHTVPLSHRRWLRALTQGEGDPAENTMHLVHWLRDDVLCVT